MGAIATGGIRILNPRVVDYLDISKDVIDLVAAREQRELQRRQLVSTSSTRESWMYSGTDVCS
jgi:predicted phosphoribosyltransferase